MLHKNELIHPRVNVKIPRQTILSFYVQKSLASEFSTVFRHLLRSDKANKYKIMRITFAALEKRVSSVVTVYILKTL